MESLDMKHRITRMVKQLGLVGLSLGLAGCNTPDDRSGRSTGRYIDDKKVAAQVRHELRHDPLYKYREVNVTAYDGTVQLSGFAINEDQRRRASEIASRIPGALAVENNISIVPDRSYRGDFRTRDRYDSGTNDTRQPVRDRLTPAERRELDERRDIDDRAR
jgi:osmotically-inducible protein OsmY